VHELDADLLRNPGLQAFMLPWPIPPVEPDDIFKSDTAIECGSLHFDLLHVPGHTPGHVCIYSSSNNTLFSGDVLFAGSVGRYDRPGASWEALLASIRMLMERLPPETIVYPGHGPATTLGRELATNPFLADLRAAAS